MAKKSGPTVTFPNVKPLEEGIRRSAEREKKNLERIARKVKSQFGVPRRGKPVALGMHSSTLVDVVEGVTVSADYSLTLAYVFSPVNASTTRQENNYTPSQSFRYDGVGWVKFTDVLKSALERRDVHHLSFVRHQDYAVGAFNGGDTQKVYGILRDLQKRYPSSS